MYLESENFTCKNGKELKIASIGPEYAEQFLKFMRQVSDDTHFMSRYGDEVGQTEKDITAERERQKRGQTIVRPSYSTSTYTPLISERIVPLCWCLMV